MAQRIVGIDLGLHTVKACVVGAGLRKSQVLAVHEATVEDVGPRGEDEPELDDLGRAVLTALRLLRDNGLMHYPAAIALPGSYASYRSLGFPFSDAKRIAQAVAFEIDGQFPVSTDQLAVDHIAVAPATKGGPGRALVVAVRGDVIERITDAFRAVNIELRLITVGAIATAQAMQDLTVVSAIEGDEQEQRGRAATLVVDIGERTTELVALTESGPVAARALRRGGRQATRALARAAKIDTASAEITKHAQGAIVGFGEGPRLMLEALTKSMTPVLREIEHTRQWLRTECDTEVTELRLTGGGALLHGLPEWIGGETDLPVLPAAPQPGFELRGFENVDGTRSLAALGAAIGAARRPLLQLRDVEAAVKGGVSFIEERFGSLMTLGVAVIAFAGVETVIHVKAMEKERNAYVDELAAVTSELFGQELLSEEEVELALAEVEGANDSRAVPERGALEVLAMLSRTVKPGKGPKPTKGSKSKADRIPVVPPDGQPGTMKNPEADDELTLAPIAPDAGIVFDDELVVTYADVRELKIKMIVTATRATAQDRLALKLEDIACVSTVQKGKIRDVNDLKQFELNFNHGCFRGSLATGASAQKQAADPDAGSEEGKGDQ